MATAAQAMNSRESLNYRELPLQKPVFLQECRDRNQGRNAGSRLEGLGRIAQRGRGMLAAPKPELTVSNRELVENPPKRAGFM